jgi:rubrerythrin
MMNAATIPDVFSIAMRLEEIGRDFYDALSLGSDDAKVRSFCLKATRDEERHRAAFQRMRSARRESRQASLGDADKIDAEAALARAQVLPDPKAVRRVALGGSLCHAIAMAMQLERDSIRHYEGLIGAGLASGGDLKAIIEEERRHLAALQMFAR